MLAYTAVNLIKNTQRGLPSKRAMMGKVNERFLRKRRVGVKE